MTLMDARRHRRHAFARSLAPSVGLSIPDSFGNALYPHRRSQRDRLGAAERREPNRRSKSLDSEV
jgi:hypothetical protein